MIEEKEMTKQCFNSRVQKGKHVNCMVGQSCIFLKKNKKKTTCTFLSVNIFRNLKLFLLPGGAGRQKESDVLRQRAEETDQSQPQHDDWRRGGWTCPE